MKVLMFILGVFLIPSLFAAPMTGPLSAVSVLAFKPSVALDTAGLSRMNVPVVAGDVAGMATISSRSLSLKLLGAAGRGALGPWGMAAITAAQLCYDQTDWKVCHSTNDPLVPINVDLSGILAAENTDIIPALPKTTYRMDGVYTSAVGDTRVDVCSAFSALYKSMYPHMDITVVGYGNEQYGNTCLYNLFMVKTGEPYGGGSASYRPISVYSCKSGYILSDSAGTASTTGRFCTPVAPVCPPDYIVTNDLGHPLSVSGKFCTPVNAYSCPTDYHRSDSYQNSDSAGMFCSYNSPYLTEQQKTDVLAPYLLDYYANQLFADKDGKTLSDIFSDPDTTFDPTVTPSDMPMTWTDLTKYTGWVNDKTAQTTNPLAPNYISPSNYNYVVNYINTNNTNNTSTGNTPVVTPETTSALTQSQYDDSNLKTSTAEKAAINAVTKPELSGLLKPLDDYKADIQSTNSNTVSTINKPSSLGYGSSTCWRPTLKSFNNTTVSPGDAYCSDYDSFSNPLAVWALWIGTALYLWHFGREQLTERV